MTAETAEAAVTAEAAEAVEAVMRMAVAKATAVSAPMETTVAPALRS